MAFGFEMFDENGTRTFSSASAAYFQVDIFQIELDVDGSISYAGLGLNDVEFSVMPGSYVAGAAGDVGRRVHVSKSGLTISWVWETNDGREAQYSDLGVEVYGR
jgi:hypothetical protein